MQTEALENYLAVDSVIDWRANAVQEAAGKITAGLDSEVEKAKALFEWVRDAIPHSCDAGREEVTCSASEVLAAGTGICYAKSHLLAALLRASAIPAGFCYQVDDDERQAGESKLILHGLNGIYLKSQEKWIRVDPRGNTNGVNARFEAERESLAFPELEFWDNCIYAAPLPQVVRALQTWPTLSQLWPHLPTPDGTER